MGACVCLFVLPAAAQENISGTHEAVAAKNTAQIDILPAKSINDDKLAVAGDITHPPLRVTPDKSELVRLDQEAGTIIVGNPLHISIFADSSQRLVLVPRAPGATFFTVLNKDGEVIMQRHVIVAAPEKEKYVRIRRSCATAGDDCQQTQVYYCPDMCHEILLNASSEASAPANDDMAKAAAQAAAASEAVPEEEPKP